MHGSQDTRDESHHEEIDDAIRLAFRVPGRAEPSRRPRLTTGRLARNPLTRHKGMGFASNTAVK